MLGYTYTFMHHKDPDRFHFNFSLNGIFFVHFVFFEVVKLLANRHLL